MRDVACYVFIADMDAMLHISTSHYLVLGAALFLLGVIGVLTRRNVVIVLMSIELILNAVNLNLVAFSRLWGGLHGQVRRTVWIEALSIATLGLVLGFALGALNLYYVVQIVHHDIAGMRLDYVFPVRVALGLVPTILGAAFVAAIWPAESAVRGSLVEALEYE